MIDISSPKLTWRGSRQVANYKNAMQNLIIRHAGDWRLVWPQKVEGLKRLEVLMRSCPWLVITQAQQVFACGSCPRHYWSELPLKSQTLAHHAMPSDTAEWNLPNFHVCSIMLSNHIPRVNLSPSSWARQSSLSIDVYTLSLFKSWVKLNGHVYILLLTGGCGWWWRRGCRWALMNACYAWPCKGSRALPYTFMGIKRRRIKKKEKAQPSLKSWSLLFSFIKGGSRLLQKATIINGGWRITRGRDHYYSGLSSLAVSDQSSNSS